MCSAFIIVVSLLALQFHLLHPCAGKSNEAEEFLQRCPPSRCGSGSVEVRYPFRLQTAPPSCGLEGLELTCSDGDDGAALLLLAPPYVPRPYAVTSINYRDLWITIASGSGSVCPFQNLTDLSQFPYYSVDAYYVSLLSCSTQFVPGPGSRIAGPVPCSPGDDTGFMYVADVVQLASNLPRDCTVVATGGRLPILLDDGERDGAGVFSYAQLSARFIERREFRLVWQNLLLGDGSLYVGGVISQCQNCERAGDSCGFSWATNQSFCIQHSHGPLALITGTSIGGFVVLLSVTVAAVYVYRLWEKKKEICLKVERFLATYDSGKPTRYSYSDIRKMTKQFRHKLGEGGFASVYKGELLNGIPVAVKMLAGEADGGGRCGEEDFVNEVATMGRIHHVNVVRLLGFCFEGTRYALVYEFMPNGSLDKFIFSKEAKRLSMGKLHEIAVGVARGVEYLHQGCDQRILHFDIKPHNILLDQNLNPKVSDFGLAKLCSREDDIVAMTAARGTMGYAAPEIYLGNLGAVSDKSDVYSFGMLLLEMVSGRKNVDPTIENQTQVYFPEWAYDRLVNAGDLGLTMGGGGNGDDDEKNFAKKLVIVALWCIQWYSLDRPSMTRVIQMLVGSLESLQFPPKPFISSSYQEMEEIVHQ